MSQLMSSPLFEGGFSLKPASVQVNRVTPKRVFLTVFLELSQTPLVSVYLEVVVVGNIQKCYLKHHIDDHKQSNVSTCLLVIQQNWC